MSALATTLDYIRFHAARRPGSIALICGKNRYTYEAFVRDTGNFKRALEQLGLPPGSSVAVAHRHPYIHWLILLACEELGLISASYAEAEGQTAATLISYVDLVLAQSSLDGARMKRFHLLSPDWIRRVMTAAHAADEDRAPSGESGLIRGSQRISRSTGTTSGGRMFVRGTAAMELQVDKSVYAGVAPGSCFLIAYPFLVGPVHQCATAHLRVGATCVAGPMMESLRDHPVTQVWALSRDLEQMLARLPADFPKRRNLHIQISGGPAFGALRKSLRERLGATVSNQYGAKEVGRVAEIGEDGVGLLFPGVRVEVVGVRDEAVPQGEPGAIRIRTPGMIDSYLEDPEATRRHFRDGWFYPGDIGVLVAPDRLKVLGRDDDLLNLGGEKHAPAKIEDSLKNIAGLDDVGVTSIRDARGAEVLCIAAVLKEGGDRAKVNRALKQEAQRLTNAHLIAFCPALPRTNVGKLQHHLLRKLFEDALAKARGRVS